MIRHWTQSLIATVIYDHQISSLTLNTGNCVDTSDTMNLTWTWVCLISDTSDLTQVSVVIRGHTWSSLVIIHMCDVT